jgi:hypothetical protein
MASLVLSGDTSGSITVSAPAVSGSNTQTLVAATGTLAPLISGTAVTASSTSVDFTSIPSWVKRITVMFQGVSTSGTSLPQIQLGDSGGVETTGYAAGSSVVAPSSIATANYTSGFVIRTDALAAIIMDGFITINLISSSTNTWVAGGTVYAPTPSAYLALVAGRKALSDTLDRVRITTVNGTDTFDAGTINILYE